MRAADRCLNCGLEQADGRPHQSPCLFGASASGLLRPCDRDVADFLRLSAGVRASQNDHVVYSALKSILMSQKIARVEVMVYKRYSASSWYCCRPISEGPAFMLSAPTRFQHVRAEAGGSRAVCIVQSLVLSTSDVVSVAQLLPAQPVLL